MKKRYYNQLTTEEFIKRARAVHGDRYDYSKVVYVNMHTKVCIICPDHGEFWQTPDKHVGCRTCPTCSKINRGVTRANSNRAKRPDLSHIEVPEGSKAVPVGTKGDYALVDVEDYDRVMEYNWHLTDTGYARNVHIGYMHRFIMNLHKKPSDMVIDHKNFTKLDNRKNNIRECSRSDNNKNLLKKRGSYTSRYKGVHFLKQTGNWKAEIRSDGVSFSLGTFNTEVEAAKAYDAAAKKYHKDFARLNFIE